jgi:2-C-methyl-D-erythritol 4-phosphate cytidylyltransferase
VVAIVLCAGQGTRMGADRNKVLLPLAGTPIAIRSIQACLRARLVHEALVVAHLHEVEELRALVAEYALRGVSAVIPGGATRHQSEHCALDAMRSRIESGEIEIALLHDGARPLVSAAAVSRLVRTARASGGALLAARAHPAETIVSTDAAGRLARVFTADVVWHAQTPQAFRARDLLAAYDAAEQAHFEGTDTASALERSGKAAHVVENRSCNLKITTPADLALAERMLAPLRPVRERQRP